jgi:phosphomannomutase
MEPDSIAVPFPLATLESGPPAPRYRCPGESDDISEGVHLSRLSTFYHKCRLCEQRTDIRRLAPALQKQWEQVLQAPEAPRLFQDNGVRGLYLNQLTRQEASQVAAAFASTLREVAEIWRSRQPNPPPPGRWLKVVFGHDSRPSSPNLAIAAATTLRQHGCELIDLSWSVRPQLDAVLHSSGADGAFFVTGHDSPVGWNGFDLVGPDGIVWSLGGMLDIVEQRFHQPCPRPEREAASQTQQHALSETLAQLRTELHGLRPLRVAIQTQQEPIVGQILRAAQSDWPGELVLEESNVAFRSAKERPFAEQKATLPADATFRLGEDARQSLMFDERGQPVSDRRIVFGLGELLLDEHPHVDVVLSDALFEGLGWTVERCGPGYLVFHRGGSTEEQLVRTMHSMNSSLGLDGAGRCWIRREGHLRCDGLLTIAMILRSLSRSDQVASQWQQH